MPSCTADELLANVPNGTLMIVITSRGPAYAWEVTDACCEYYTGLTKKEFRCLLIKRPRKKRR